MRERINAYFKIVFLTGAILLFLSFFLDWYVFQVYDSNNEIIASWSYNIIFEWSTDFPQGITTNEDNRPVNLNAPLVIVLLFGMMLILAVYVVLFKSITSSRKTSQKRYSFPLLSLLILNGFYIVGFPIMYLFPNELYFPVLTIQNVELHTTVDYSISFGYILQLCGFVLVVPYVLFYYFAAVELERLEHKPEVRIEKYVKSIQEPLDLDKFIAEEEYERLGGVHD
jgi:hypothetical protein